MADEEMRTEAEKAAEESAETQDKNPDAEAQGKVDEAEEARKAEEAIKQEFKEVQASVQHFTPHRIPDWELEQIRESYMWQVRIFPIDQEDCRNSILETATKIAQNSWYYVPKRKNGEGIAELSMASINEAKTVMSRIVRMPFYHHYVTVEITKRVQEEYVEYAPYSKIEETAIIVLDSTKGEKLKNTSISRGDEKERSLWIRYLPENTSPDMLHVIFPLSRTAAVQEHGGLQIGVVEALSKADLLVFMKSYVTVIINDKHVLSLLNTEPKENENEIKADLEKRVQVGDEMKPAPTEVADKSNQRKDDKNETNRILKRTLQQQPTADGRQAGGRQGSGEPSAKRGLMGNYPEGRFDSRWGSSNSPFAAALLGRSNRAGFGGQINPRGMAAAEMIMMQARLNQTIRSQLMMLNPGARRAASLGFGGGRYLGGGSRLLSGRRGRHSDFGGGW